MGTFYRPTGQEIREINRKADTWQMTVEKFGFFIEPIVTEEAQAYAFYRSLDSGDIYVDYRGVSSNKGMVDYYYGNEEEEKKVLFEAIKRVNNGEIITYSN